MLLDLLYLNFCPSGLLSIRPNAFRPNIIARGIRSPCDYSLKNSPDASHFAAQHWVRKDG